MPWAGGHCPLPQRPWARAAPQVPALTCQPCYPLGGRGTEGPSLAGLHESLWVSPGREAGGCGPRTCPWAPPRGSADLLTVTGRRGSVLLYKGLSCSPHPTGGVPREFPGTLPVPQPTGQPPQALLPRAHACPHPPWSRRCTICTPSVPPAPPPRQQPGAGPRSSLEGHIPAGQTLQRTRGSREEQAQWGCEGAAQQGPSDPGPGPPGWQSLRHAAVGRGESQHLVSSGAWRAGAAEPTLTPVPSSSQSPGFGGPGDAQRCPSGSSPACSMPAKKAGSQLMAWHRRTVLPAWEKPCRHPEEAAFQLGLSCLEGFGRRKRIADGSEGGGYRALSLPPAQLCGVSGLCLRSLSAAP